MQALERLLKNTIALDADDLMFDILKQENDVIDLIVSLNTDSQLFEGFDSNGKSLVSIGGSYSPITLQIKRKKNQPTNRVTLKDTGDFYNSFEVIVKKDGFVIEADAVKDNTDLQDRWGDDIIGLSEMSKEELVFFLTPLLIEYVKDAIFKGV